MRLVSYGEFGHERAGILYEKKIIDLQEGMRVADCSVPVSDMRLFLEQKDWRHSAELVWARKGNLELIDVANVRLGSPVPVPRKLLIAGANTKSHIAEAESVLVTPIAPKEPMILAKATSSICGPFDEVIHPPETRKLDYEVELGVVIGRQGRRISESDVKDYIAGFTVINEMSARDIQLAEHEDNPFFRVHFVGKSFDTFNPMGPALVTLDEFEWGKALPLRTEVNGEVRQDDDTDDLYYGIERLVSYISQVMTLFPGDVIATGSPAGVANFMDPPQFLQPGDVVRCEIAGIGAIENRIVQG
ncbi:fumarylacetoacetate hydrolase family protein [Caballeronia novacaledonica]|uniref:Fumarylacetoacetate hydrolase family protein n=1 Tax=Caballeronia novacaledonica TaxID=1544861 RepID=A0AA37IN18_9BURK|nr:fumarylacetoacetate hydrolase family protein [Caballeronia novacaledonica]GJH29360.1 fumarylacetoacetate hydrolase family protein [Caballeronia novacaledonica]